MTDIAPEAHVAVRVALLRSIVESDYGRAESAAGELRTKLARRQPALDPVALELELALLRLGSTFGPGVSLGWLRLPLLDPILNDLERLDVANLGPDLLHEIEEFAVHLETPGLRDEREAYQRRPRLIDAIHRAETGRLSPLAFDPGDDYGAAMRAMVETDQDLAAELYPLYALIGRASTVLPEGRWDANADAVVGIAPSSVLRAAVIRSIRPALDIDLPQNVSLPGFPGALRITNQMLLRGLLWTAARLDPAWAADAFADIGIYYGTSGRHDNTARDAAIAGTCAALLGVIASPEAAASLARMDARITNRPVDKQIASALERLAAAAAAPADELFIDAALPTFDLDAGGHRRLAAGNWTALVAVSPEGAVGVTWHGPGDTKSEKAPAAVRNDHPGEVAAVADLVKRIRAAITEERSRVELDFAHARVRRFDSWKARWFDHPIGRVFGRRLIWEFATDDGVVVGLPTGDRIVDADGRPVDLPTDGRVLLWHPVDAEGAVVDAWRRRIVAEQVVQPAKQAFRETYAPASDAGEALLDRRFAGRALDQGHLRALMRQRRWSGPALGPWDQGGRATISRDLAGSGWRAEFDLEAAGQAAPNDPVTVVRSGSVRFMTGTGRDARPATMGEVPPRIRSEVLRDVDLFTAVGDITRVSPGGDEPDETSTVVANRASILRAVIPALAIGHRLSVFGRWLRVEGDTGAFAISLVDGSALSLEDESPIDAPRGPADDHRPTYLPDGDDATLNAIVDLAHRLVKSNLD